MAVKRVESDFDIHLPPVRLFLDDLQQILDRLADHTDIKFRHAEYVYDSLEELTDHVRRRWIPSLAIRARAKNLSYSDIVISFEQNGTWVRADHGSAEKAAVIAYYLTSKVPWYSWHPTGSWWYAVRGGLAVVLAMAVGAALPDLIPGPSGVRVLLAAAFGGVLFLMAMPPDRLWLGGTHIGLYSAVSQPSFWERNRDRILVGALLSLMSVLFGFLLGRITQ